MYEYGLHTPRPQTLLLVHVLLHPYRSDLKPARPKPPNIKPSSSPLRSGIPGQFDLSVAFGADLPPYRPAPDASRNPRFQHLNNDLMSHLPRQPLDLGLQSFNSTGQLTDQHKSHQTKSETKHRHRYHGFTLLFIIDLTKRCSTDRIVSVWPFRF